MTLREAVNRLKLMPDNKIFIRYDRKDGESELLVGDADRTLLNKKVRYIQRHYGGKQNGYSCHRFILEQERKCSM